MLVIKTSAQEKSFPLSDLANCKIYEILSSDSLKKSEAYKSPKNVYAINYSEVGRSKKENWNELPFSTSDFPNLQFLIMSNVFTIPENLGSFENLQVLFIHYNDRKGNEGEEYSEILFNRPRFFPETFYTLQKLKILYTNHLPPLGALYFDIEKLKGMKGLQLIDLPDGLMDDKIIPAFFAPQIKVLINSDRDYNNFYRYRYDIRSIEMDEYKMWNDSLSNSRKVYSFENVSGSILSVYNQELHNVWNYSKSEKSYKVNTITNNNLLKAYVGYIDKTEKIIKDPLLKEFNIYNSDFFSYSANLIKIQDKTFPALDTTEFRKNHLYSRHTGFVKYKVEQKTTIYYYTYTGSYIMKTSYYNGLQSYIVDIKWYSVLPENKIQIKWIKEIDENTKYYDYTKTKQFKIARYYKLQEIFNKEIILK